MSTLAAQLKQLQIPGLHKDVSKPQHVSILFDKNVAATLDMESIYNVGVSGFDQMMTIEPILIDYQELLFSQKSIHLQRTMEDKSFNKKISKAIEEFLLLLSPYLQLQAAKKCLEWLVWRFEIHNFDRDSLLQCILPYHETQLFGRIVQLVHESNYGSTWEHLLLKLKGGGIVNTRTIIKHCRENTNLLVFVYGMAEKAVKLQKKKPKSGLGMIFSFYARTMCGVLGESSSYNLSESLLTKVLSMIHYGLASNCKDFICATYIVITMFASKSPLKRKALTSLIVHVLKVF